MPSSRSIGKLIAVLVVVLASLGFAHDPVLGARLACLSGGSGGYFRGHDKAQQQQDVAQQSVKLFSARPDKQKDKPVKRHKRLLISKFFQPMPATVIFLKKYRVAEPRTDYSSSHIIQRTIAVASLRGPPLS